MMVIPIPARRASQGPPTTTRGDYHKERINIVDFAKYLEVFIDKDLDFKEHKVLESKVARAVGILTKLLN